MPETQWYQRVRIFAKDKHLKERILNLHPVCIAEMGLDFYTVFVEEAESRFDDG